MATVPRQGRKGGKITATPSQLPEDRTVSPSSQVLSSIPPATAAAATAPDADLRTPPLAPNATSTLSDTNVLQFDLDAIQHIGQGVVVGGSKVQRAGTRTPRAHELDVHEKLEDWMNQRSKCGKQGGMSDAFADALRQSTEAGLKEMDTSNVLVVTQPRLALSLAMAVTRSVSTSKVLIVVPKYYEVEPVAASVGAMAASEGLTGAAASVGVLCGQVSSGYKDTQLWVTSADTLLLLRTTTKGVAPFTHIVFPGLSTSTQLQWYTVATLQPLFETGAVPPPKLIINCEAEERNNLKYFFENCKTVVLPFQEFPVNELTYDEACALTKKRVLEVDADRSGNSTVQHKKLTENSIEIAVQLVKTIVSIAKDSPQSIIIFTAEVRMILVSLLAAVQNFPNPDAVGVFSGRTQVGGNASCTHKVFVMTQHQYSLDGDDEEATVVIDLGSAKKTVAGSKSESFMSASVTAWATKRDIAQRKAVLASSPSGVYIAVYPENEAAKLEEGGVAPQDASNLEEAILQCARNHVNLNLKTPAPFIPLDTIKQVTHDLAEKCVTASPSNLSLTFLGEFVSRLPLSLDTSYLVALGCMLGIGEAALVIASVASIPFRAATPSNETKSSWIASTNKSRERYAGNLAKQSELLADSLVFLEWLMLKVSKKPTEELLAETHAKESRLEKILVLMSFMRVQLSDYVFLDEYTPDVIGAVRSTIINDSSILIFCTVTAFARRSAFIRDTGKLNIADRHAALVFVRSPKHVVAHSFTPNTTAWESGAVIVAVDLNNYMNVILASSTSTLSTPYFFASLLLLYQQIEYSAPVTTSVGCVVYFGLTCNNQMKRFSVSIEEAAQILDFRENLNTSLGCMQALRTLPRPTTRTKLAIHLMEEDRSFNLTKLQRDLRQQLLELVTDIDVSEHQGSFETLAVHSIEPKTVAPPPPTAIVQRASDVVMLASFADGSQPTALAPKPVETASKESSTTSAIAADNKKGAPATSVVANDSFMASAIRGGLSPWNGSQAPPSGLVRLPPLFDDDEDGVEVADVSYFVRNGPLIEDDDDY